MKKHYQRLANQVGQAAKKRQNKVPVKTSVQQQKRPTKLDKEIQIRR